MTRMDTSPSRRRWNRGHRRLDLSDIVVWAFFTAAVFFMLYLGCALLTVAWP